MSPWCVGGVSGVSVRFSGVLVVSRRCLGGGGAVVSQWCLGGILVVSWRCLRGVSVVSVVSRCVSVVSWWCLGGVSAVSWWWWGRGVSVVLFCGILVVSWRCLRGVSVVSRCVSVHH